MRPGGQDQPIASWAIASVIAEVCARAGIPYEAIDFELVEGGVDGIMTSANTDAYATIEALSGMFLFDVVNYDGQLHMIPRGGDVVAELTLDDLVDDGSDIDKSERLDSIEVPRVLNLEYHDYDGGLTPDKQASDRSLDIRSKGEARNQTPIILRTADAARAVVIQHKVMIEEQRGGYEFSLPDSWIWLTCGDVIRLEGERLRITEIEINEGFQKYKTAFDRASAYSSTVQGVPIDQPSVPPTLVVGDTVLQFIDSHILEDADDTLGYYLAANGPDLWRGAIVELSLDGGETYIDSDSAGAPSIMGELVTPLASGSMHYPDLVNTCRVRLLRTDQSLLDATLGDMQNRINLAIVGDELINFGNADEVEPGLWDLSYFLRGRKGSPVTSHAAGSRFVMLNIGALAYISADLFLLGRNLTFRVTSVDGDRESQVFTVPFVGRSQTERQPAYLRARRIGGNLEISWQGVGRLGGGGRVGMGAQFDGFRVTINGAAQNTTARTLTVTDPGGAVTISVQQINRITGLGPAITVVA
jgi:hypothetical protein